MIVFSAIKNFKKREAIRNTWASEKIPNAKVVFFLGILDDKNNSLVGDQGIIQESEISGKNLQEMVFQESEIFGDILQENFIDTYGNSSVKSLMMLKWFKQACPKIPYLMKTGTFQSSDLYIDFFFHFENLSKTFIRLDYLMLGMCLILR